jgi:radical SAM-linked protein
LRIWYEKLGPASYLSQLELQRLFERLFRRAELPLAFSAGFHPLPLLSFGKALPVGVESREEWLNITLREEWAGAGSAPRHRRAPAPRACVCCGWKRCPDRQAASGLLGGFSFSSQRGRGQEQLQRCRVQWENFLAAILGLLPEQVEKRGPGDRYQTPGPDVTPVKGGFLIRFDWHNGYLSPLRIISAVHPDLPREGIGLTKIRQWMDNGHGRSGADRAAGQRL